jgi:tetratricopeptide (TPR) repeat protein
MDNGSTFEEINKKLKYLKVEILLWEETPSCISNMGLKIKNVKSVTHAKKLISKFSSSIIIFILNLKKLKNEIRSVMRSENIARIYIIKQEGTSLILSKRVSKKIYLTNLKIFVSNLNQYLHFFFRQKQDCFAKVINSHSKFIITEREKSIKLFDLNLLLKIIRDNGLNEKMAKEEFLNYFVNKGKCVYELSPFFHKNLELAQSFDEELFKNNLYLNFLIHKLFLERDFVEIYKNRWFIKGVLKKMQEPKNEYPKALYRECYISRNIFQKKNNLMEFFGIGGFFTAYEYHSLFIQNKFSSKNGKPIRIILKILLKGNEDYIVLNDSSGYREYLFPPCSVLNKIKERRKNKYYQFTCIINTVYELENLVDDSKVRQYKLEFEKRILNDVKELKFDYLIMINFHPFNYNEHVRNKLIAQLPQDDDKPEFLITFFYYIGISFFKTKDYTKGYYFWNKLINSFLEINEKSHPFYLKTMQCISFYYLQIKNYLKAINIMKECIEVCVQNYGIYHKETIKTFCNYVLALLDVGKTKEAKKVCQLLVQIRHTTPCNDILMEERINFCLALFYRECKLTDLANEGTTEYLKKLKKIFGKYNGKYYKWIIEMAGISKLERNRGRTFEILKASKKICKNIYGLESNHLADLYYSYAEFYRTCNNYEKVKKYLNKAETIYRITENIPELQNILHNLGFAYKTKYLLGGRDEAVKYFQMCLELKKELYDINDVPTMQELGIHYLANGRQSEGISILTKARKIYSKNEVIEIFKDDIVDCLLEDVIAYKQVKDYDNAVDVLYQAAKIDESIHTKSYPSSEINDLFK